MVGYIFKFKGQSFVPDGRVRNMTDEEIEEHNRKVSKEEYEIFNSTFPPKRYFLYPKWIDGKLFLTTWISDLIGEVTQLGHKYRSNLGDHRQSFQAKIGLYKYHGYIYNDMYCRVTLSKDN